MKTERMVKGRHTMASAEKAFRSEFEDMAEAYVDKLLEEGDFL